MPFLVSHPQQSHFQGVLQTLEVIMEFKFLPFLAFLIVASEAADQVRTTPPEIYLNSVLPNMAIPAAIKDILNLGKEAGLQDGSGNQGEKILSNAVELPDLNDEEDRSLFFMEEEMLPGKAMKFKFMNRTNAATFLPRGVAESMTFSLNKFPDILNQFSKKPDSREANIMRRSLKKCEDVKMKGWKNETCVTSLESMVELVTTVLGTHVQAYSSEVKQEDAQLRQSYTSEFGVQKIHAPKFVACHKVNYPVAVFYCHTFDAYEAYGVRAQLKGSNGAEVVGVGVCHIKRNEWLPYIARTPARMAKVRAGLVPLCHFLAGDTTVWTAKGSTSGV